MKQQQNFAATYETPKPNPDKMQNDFENFKQIDSGYSLSLKMLWTPGLFVSALLLMSCATSTLPSDDFDLNAASAEIEAPCKWPAGPKDGSSRTLKRKLAEVYAALADCAERKQASQDHANRQRAAIKDALKQ